MSLSGRGVVSVLFTIAAACGGKQHPSGVSGGGGGGDPSTDCEPGRCLEDVAKVIEDHHAEARTCYDEGVKVDPALHGGRVVINFEIDPGGTVVDSSQSMEDDQITDPAVVDCIAGVIKEIRFARSGHGKSTRAFHRFEFGARAQQP